MQSGDLNINYELGSDEFVRLQARLLLRSHSDSVPRWQIAFLRFTLFTDFNDAFATGVHFSIKGLARLLHEIAIGRVRVRDNLFARF